MKQQSFEAAHQEAWSRLDTALLQLEKGQSSDIPEDLPALYRKVCQHLALARERQYGAGLVDRLNGLVLKGHQRLYGTQPGLGWGWFRFLARDFPRAVRSRWKSVLLATVLFFGPTVVLTLAVPRHPELAYLVEEPHALAMYEAMYADGKESFGRKDQSDSDVMMFGHYIWNNVRIDFQTFGMGILGAVGSIFFLFYNGLHGGAVAGHLVRVGLGHNFWPFVITHTAVEVTGLILAGAAGMELGWSVVAPGRRARRAALRHAVELNLPLLYGAAAMTFIAAFIEAFWSSSARIAPQVKYAVGGTLWGLVLLYLLFAGRRGQHA